MSFTIGLLAQAATPTPAAPKPIPNDQVVAFVLLGFLLILVTARVVGWVFVKIGQPRVVGEIVAGILLGPSLLGPAIFHWKKPWGVLACDRTSVFNLAAGAPAPRMSISSCLFPVQARSVLGAVGQIALMLFMFSVGTQLDFTRLKGQLRGVMTVAVGVVLIPLAAAFLLGPVLYGSKFTGLKPATNDAPAHLASKLAFTLFIAGMLSVTAFPVAVRILQEKKLDQTQMGVVTVASAAVVTVLMFLLVGVARGVDAKQSTGDQLMRLLGVGVMMLCAAFVARPVVAYLWEHLKSPTDRLAIAIVAALLFAYASDRIGVNVIVGGFIGGAVMPRTDDVAKVVDRFNDLTITVLLPIFLAVSGLQTDFTKLSSAVIGGIALFLVVGIASKWGGGLVSAKLGGLSWSEGNVLGILMNCRGLLVLVVALIGLEAKVITAPLQIGGVLMALVTTAMTGPLIDKFLSAPSAATAAKAP